MTVSLDGEVRDGRHYMQVRVYFEDTDAGQIVYHANFCLSWNVADELLAPARQSVNEGAMQFAGKPASKSVTAPPLKVGKMLFVASRKGRADLAVRYQN